MILLLQALLLIQIPVVELDNVYIEGNIRRPLLLELKKSQLKDRIDEVALANLLRLEEKLLKPKNLSKLREEK